VISPPWVLCAAFAADWLIGEPPALLHPVVWIGRLAARAERALLHGGRGRQLAAGLAVTVAIPCVLAGASAWLGAALGPWPAMQAIAAIWLLKSTFALRALGRAAGAVERALVHDDLAAGREALRSLCSRDPSALPAPALVAATIESVAENASDSVVAPLLYFALFGIPGAIFYRAVNTLDAMIGYHGRYEYFGKAAARLDDLLNLVPARLTAGLILLAGAATRHDVRRGARTMLRDHARTESPNAGWPMAAMAGLLGIELEKQDHYRLGDPTRPIAVQDIRAAWRIVVGVGLAAVTAACALSMGRIRG
jgi:adenosylcobinamide-phosphate synthase